MDYNEIKNILLSMSDPVERLEFVMDLGKTIKPIPDTAICKEISGCASVAKICRDGNNFYGFADSALVRGIVVIIISMVNGKTADEIKNMNLSENFAQLNINLGAGRMNGVNSMINFLENL